MNRKLAAKTILPKAGGPASLAQRPLSSTRPRRGNLAIVFALIDMAADGYQQMSDTRAGRKCRPGRIFCCLVFVALLATTLALVGLHLAQQRALEELFSRLGFAPGVLDTPGGVFELPAVAQRSGSVIFLP